MKNIIKRSLCGIAAASMAVSLVACGNAGELQGGSSGDGEKASVVQRINVGINVVDANERQTSGEGKQALNSARSSVVEITAVITSQSQTQSNIGSGVVINSAKVIGEDADPEEVPETVSYIVTCYHLVKSATEITVKDIFGNEYRAKPIGADDRTDICVLSVGEELYGATFLTGEDLLEVGEDVFAIGNPLGTLGGTVTKGIISAVNRDLLVGGVTLDLYQTDATVNAGSAGGGLFTEDGYFVGLLNDEYMKEYSSVSGLSFVTPSETVKDISTKLMETYSGDTLGFIEGRYYLGCKVANRYTNVWQTSSYVVINSLDSAGSFYKGGLRVGDQIVSVEFNGVETAVTNADKFLEYIDSLSLSVGDRLKFNVKRNDHSYIYQVEILQYICGAE